MLFFPHLLSCDSPVSVQKALDREKPVVLKYSFLQYAIRECNKFLPEFCAW